MYHFASTHNSKNFVGIWLFQDLVKENIIFSPMCLLTTTDCLKCQKGYYMLWMDRHRWPNCTSQSKGLELDVLIIIQYFSIFQAFKTFPFSKHIIYLLASSVHLFSTPNVMFNILLNNQAAIMQRRCRLNPFSEFHNTFLITIILT